MLVELIKTFQKVVKANIWAKPYYNCNQIGRLVLSLFLQKDAKIQPSQHAVVASARL